MESFLEKPLELGLSSQYAIENLWRIENDVLKLCASMVSLVSPFLVAILYALNQGLRSTELAREFNVAMVDLPVSSDVGYNEHILPEEVPESPAVKIPSIPYMLTLAFSPRLGLGYSPKIGKMGSAKLPTQDEASYGEREISIKPEESMQEEAGYSNFVYRMAELQQEVQSKATPSLPLMSSAAKAYAKKGIPLALASPQKIEITNLIAYSDLQHRTAGSLHELNAKAARQKAMATAQRTDKENILGYPIFDFDLWLTPNAQNALDLARKLQSLYFETRPPVVSASLFPHVSLQRPHSQSISASPPKSGQLGLIASAQKRPTTLQDSLLTNQVLAPENEATLTRAIQLDIEREKSGEQIAESNPALTSRRVAELISECDKQIARSQVSLFLDRSLGYSTFFVASKAKALRRIGAYLSALPTATSETNLVIADQPSVQQFSIPTSYLAKAIDEVDASVGTPFREPSISAIPGSSEAAKHPESSVHALLAAVVSRYAAEIMRLSSVVSVAEHGSPFLSDANAFVSPDMVADLAIAERIEPVAEAKQHTAILPKAPAQTAVSVNPFLEAAVNAYAAYAAEVTPFSKMIATARQGSSAVSAGPDNYLLAAVASRYADETMRLSQSVNEVGTGTTLLSPTNGSHSSSVVAGLKDGAQAQPGSSTGPEASMTPEIAVLPGGSINYLLAAVASKYVAETLPLSQMAFGTKDSVLSRAYFDSVPLVPPVLKSFEQVEFVEKGAGPELEFEKRKPINLGLKEVSEPTINGPDGKIARAGMAPELVDQSGMARSSAAWRKTSVKTAALMIPSVPALVAHGTVVVNGFQRELSAFANEALNMASTYRGSIIDLGVVGHEAVTMLGESSIGLTPPIPVESPATRGSVFHPPPRPTLTTPTIHDTFSVSVPAEASDEDLRDLERKISRMLSEQMSRYYGSTRP